MYKEQIAEILENASDNLEQLFQESVRKEADSHNNEKLAEAKRKEAKWRTAGEEAEKRRKHLVGRVQDLQKKYDESHAKSMKASAEVDSLKKSCDMLNSRLDAASKELAKFQQKAEEAKKEDTVKAES